MEEHGREGSWSARCRILQVQGFEPRKQDFWKGLNHYPNGLVGHFIHAKHFWIYLPNLS